MNQHVFINHIMVLLGPANSSHLHGIIEKMPGRFWLKQRLAKPQCAKQQKQTGPQVGAWFHAIAYEMCRCSFNGGIPILC